MDMTVKKTSKSMASIEDNGVPNDQDNEPNTHQTCPKYPTTIIKSYVRKVLPV